MASWYLTAITLFSTFSYATSRTLLQITTQTQYPTLPSPPPSSPITSPSFRPSIPVIIGIITILFAVTFLILLYTRNCNRTGDATTTTTTIGAVAYYLGGSHHPRVTNTTFGYGLPVVSSSSIRKNSGVDRTLVESLPVFRFGSLRGHKDGLECAVCLNRFEPVEVLRLLPKCKHAFHVECVDTWLDAHSTCPLCRYRVDPEDLLLLIDETVPTSSSNFEIPRSDVNRKRSSTSFVIDTIRRVAGRHSSAGEMVLIQGEPVSSYRRSYEGARSYGYGRRVVDTRQQSIRKDGLLPTIDNREDTETGMGIGVRKKVEHQIIISDESVKSLHKRWSDVLPSSDLLYLRSEMVMNDARRSSSSKTEGDRRGSSSTTSVCGTGRSMSEMTGLSRLAMTTSGGGGATAL